MPRVKRPRLVSAAAMHKKHPKTFKVPAARTLAAIVPGDFIKVCAGAERFWCVVLTVKGRGGVARVDNTVLNTKRHGLRYRDRIRWTFANVYQVMKGKRKSSLF